MSPASLPDNPSPELSVPPAVIQATKHEVPNSQQTSPGVSPGPVRRPSFEKLDSDEVAKAMGVAAALKKMKPYSPPAKPKKKEVAKPPPPKPAVYIPRPPPVPFSGNSNPDAIALRSSASLLQMQAAKARQDLETLEQLKALASEDPLAFTQELVTGRVKQEASSGGVLGATLAPLESLFKKVDPDDIKGTEEEAMKEISDTQESEHDDITSASSSSAPASNSTSKFPSIPAPQNIIRMPPINWSKYGVVGGSLDKMHEEQRTNPSPSQPEILATRDSQPSRPIMEQYQHNTEKAAPYVVAAPYDPLKDHPLSGAKVADSRRGTSSSTVKRSMARAKSKANKDRVYDSPSRVDDAYSPCKRRKGFDEVRGTEVAYSLYGELGIYLPNPKVLQPKEMPLKVASNGKSCFSPLTSPNPLKQYYDSMRKPRAQNSSSRVLTSSPFPTSIRAVSPSPTPSPTKAGASPRSILKRGHKKLKNVRFDACVFP